MTNIDGSAVEGGRWDSVETCSNARHRCSCRRCENERGRGGGVAIAPDGHGLSVAIEIIVVYFRYGGDGDCVAGDEGA